MVTARLGIFLLVHFTDGGTARKRHILEKAVKLELIETSVCETGSAKEGTQKGKVGSAGPPLQEKDKNVVKVKTEPRASTVGLLDATLSVNVRGKHKDWPIDMGMSSACRREGYGSASTYLLIRGHRQCAH